VSDGLGWLVDLVIGFTLFEGLLLAWWYRRSGRGVAPAEYLANMVSGLCLMLALRSALHGGAGATVALWLTAAGLAHGADLWRRWQRRGRVVRPA
jgi:hypothetical protein